MIKMWDAHVHLFPERLFKAIFRWFIDFGWEMPYAGLNMERYVAKLQEMGVERAFLLTYAHKPDMSLELNAWVRDFCRQYPLFIPFACIHPKDNGLEQVITTVLDDWNFAGFKLQLVVQQFAADDPGLQPVYEAALKRRKPVIIHTGTAPYSQDDPLLGLAHLEKVMAKWPELIVVVPHFGLYELEKSFSLVENYPNFYLDTSWVLGNPKESLPLDKLVDFMERYPKRFLYGSDFPLIEQKPELGLEALYDLGLTQETLQKVLCENARRLVGEA